MYVCLFVSIYIYICQGDDSLQTSSMFKSGVPPPGTQRGATCSEAPLYGNLARGEAVQCFGEALRIAVLINRRWHERVDNTTT